MDDDGPGGRALGRRQPDRLGQHLERCPKAAGVSGTAYAALDRALGTLRLEAALPARLEQVTLRRARLADGDARTGTLGGAGSASRSRRSLRRRSWWSPPGSRSWTAARCPPRRRPSTRRPRHRSVSQSGPAHRRRLPRRRPASGAAPPAWCPGEPPPELAARPDLFVNLPLLRNLDKLQHYEAIQTISVDGRNGGQSSG